MYCVLNLSIVVDMETVTHTITQTITQFFLIEAKSLILSKNHYGETSLFLYYFVFFRQKTTRNLFNLHQFPIKFGRLFYLFYFYQTSFGIMPLSMNISFSMCFVYMRENLYYLVRDTYFGPVLCINFQHFLFVQSFLWIKIGQCAKDEKGCFLSRTNRKG